MKINSETSRIRAALVNSGRYSFVEAERKLESLRLDIQIGSESAATLSGQAAALTAVVTASRCFLGGVTLTGAIDQPLILPLPLPADTLGQAAILLGATRRLSTQPSRVVVVGSQKFSDSVWSIRAIWNGWSAGIVPGNQSSSLVGRSDCALAGIAAGALAVCNAFSAEQNDPFAGEIIQGISLWEPDKREQWLNNNGPDEYYLPDAIWLVGLGNLGQAYLWNLSLLPYSDPTSLQLFFQDDDIVSEENWGTSILVKRGNYGILKTRLAEEWAESRRFRSRRIDRRLDEHLRRISSEPNIAMAGLDKMSARRLLGRPGFDYIIDGGLGATAHDYRRFRLNVFDQSLDPASHFSGVLDASESKVEDVLRLPAYREVENTQHFDSCGMAELAGQSVAVPFVSVFLASIAVTQAIRLASNQNFYRSITGDLNDLRSIRTVLGSISNRTTIGYTEMKH